METIEIRPITNQQELSECLDLWATVFPENRAFFEERLDYDPAYRQENTWIAKVNGEVAASVQIFPYYTNLEGIPIKVGGIGSVATLSKYRGRHLTHIILQRQSEWMKRQGYDLSLLFTGINPFYEKVGWSTLPTSRYQAEVSKLKKHLKPESSSRYKVVSYKSDDQKDVQAIYETFSEPYFGPAKRSASYWLGQLQWRKEKANDFLVATHNNRVAGYLRVKESQPGYLEVTECCYLPEHEEAISALVQEALKNNPEAYSLITKVPKTHALYHLLEKSEVKETKETHEMWKILNMPSLSTKLNMILTKRLENHKNIKDKLLFLIDNDQLLVSINDGVVDVTDLGEAFSYQYLYKRTSSEFLVDLIYGTTASDPILQKLFPKRDYLYWSTDSF